MIFSISLQLLVTLVGQRGDAELVTAGERRNKDTWRSRQGAARGPRSALKPRLRRQIGHSAVSAAGKAAVRPRVLGLGPA